MKLSLSIKNLIVISLLLFCPRILLAWYHYPTFIMPGEQITNLGSRASDQNIALHKAVVDSFYTLRPQYEPWRFLAWAEEMAGNMQKAVDGDPVSCMDEPHGQFNSWLELDLGAMFIIDSTNVTFKTDYPTNQQYSIRVGTPRDPNLPPTYNLETGLGMIPHSNTYWGTPEYQTADPVGGNGPIPVIDFRPAILIDDAKKVDGRKWNPIAGRFLHINLGAINGANWQQLTPCEVQVFGHPYTPSPNDDVYVSRLKWSGSAYSDGGSDVGPGIRQLFDGFIDNMFAAKKNLYPGATIKIDMVDTTSFNKMFIIFNTRLPSPTPFPKMFDLYATNDTLNWGNVVSQIDYKDTVTSVFPLQTGKRFLKIVATGTTDGWFVADELLLYRPYSNSAPLKINKSNMTFSHFSKDNSSLTHFYSPTGKKISKSDLKEKSVRLYPKFSWRK